MSWQRPALIALAAAMLVAGAVAALVVNLGTVTALRSGENVAAEALLRLEMLLSAVKDAETDTRGYLLTADDAYLGAYPGALRSIEENLSAAREVAADEDQDRRFEAIAALARAKLRFMQSLVETRRAEGAEAALAIFRTGDGRRLMGTLRDDASALRQVILENREAAHREAWWRAAGSAGLVFGGGILTALLLGLAALALHRRLAGQERSVAAILKERAAAEFERVSAGVLLDALPVGVVLADEGGRIVQANAEAQRLHGDAGPHSAPARRFEDGHPLPAEEMALSRALRSGERQAGEAILIGLPEGGDAVVLNSAAPVRDNAGRVLGAVAILQDITARQREQDRRREAEAQYRAIVETAADAIATIDDAGILHSFNPAAERVFGYAAAEVVGSDVAALMPERAAHAHAGVLARYSASGRRLVSWTGRALTGRRKDGGEFPLELSLAEWRTSAGERRFTGVMRDLTERRRAEETIRAQAEQQAAIMDALPAGIALLNPRGRIAAVNAAWRGFAAANDFSGPDAGLGADYLAVCDAAAALGDAAARRVAEGVRTVLENRAERFETEYACHPPDGRRWFRLVATSRSRGRRDGAVLMHVDVTETRLAEEALRDLQSEFLRVARLSEIGQMTAILADELNQPLAAMTNYLGGARRVLEGPAPDERMPMVREALASAARRAVEAGQIVRRMRGFVAPGDGARRPEDLAGLVEEALDLVAPAARRLSVQVRLDLGPARHLVLADRAQVRQVLVNLMHNAVESMEAAEPPRRLTVSARPAEGGMVEIAVSDTGPGIAAEVAENLFRSFFTTKRGGLGVGLSVCRSIVEGHGGRIQAEPNPGGGAVFRFTLQGAHADG